MTELSRAIVTGATSGIGEATVRALTSSGRQVLAIARREERLRALANATGAEFLAADVRDLDEHAAHLTGFEPDILINNAGVGHGISGLDGMTSDQLQEAFDINVVAPLNLIACLTPGMKARRRGHIVNIGSIAGLHTLLSAVYGGTKSAIHRISQNLRFELSGTGIRVTEIAPGRVASEFYQAAEGDRERLAAMGVSGIRELQPEDIANAILFAVDAPAHVNVATLEILPTEQAVGGIKAEAVKD
ncbi:SDR family oxidoreductase [Hoeflea poritis]|uniref:SDR family oxidoreductase n=1 Tax=Hoeflea poritis TaxID=2993659 RepID=A0ABT4VUH2_9HYPH|nr:SDR family oxidoreductase [Hoeflea poritis]MDA4848360.1 SDR family oxidoreductase [Hoeflea poritis]